MNTRLNYNLVPAQSAGDRLTVAVPHIIWQRLASHNGQADNIAMLSANRTNAIALESTDAGYVISINDKRIGASQSQRRDKLAKGVCLLLASLDQCAGEGQKDTGFEASVGTTPVNNTGRFMMRMKVNWPETNDSRLTVLAASQMQATAVKLRYAPQSQVADLVYAQINRQHGVTLQTNPVGSCSVDTDGSEYQPTKPRFNLYAHNLYSPTQQLICLVGGVAIARASSLASDTAIC